MVAHSGRTLEVRPRGIQAPVVKTVDIVADRAKSVHSTWFCHCRAALFRIALRKPGELASPEGGLRMSLIPATEPEIGADPLPSLTA